MSKQLVTVEKKKVDFNRKKLQSVRGIATCHDWLAVRGKRKEQKETGQKAKYRRES